MSKKIIGTVTAISTALIIASCSVLETEDKKDTTGTGDGNIDSSTAVTIPIGSTVEGQVIDAIDEDFYRITLPKSGLLRIDIKNIPSSLKGATVYLWNPSMTGVIANEELDGSSYGIYKNLNAGTYYLQTGYKYSFNVAFSETKFTIQVAYDTIDIHEPNDKFGNATVINLGSTYKTKLIASDDVDVFKFSISKPTVLRLDIDSISMALNDLYLYYYDDEGTKIGTYAYFESDTARYGRFFDKAGDYYLSFNAGNGQSDVPFTFKLNEYKTDTNEYNNTIQTASKIEVPFIGNGNFFPKNDVDYFEVNLTDSTELSVALTNVSSKHASGIYLYDPEGTKIGSESYKSAGLNNNKTWNVKAGKYLVMVTGYDNESEKLYNLSISAK